MDQLENILNLIVEVEKLKDVHRKTRPVGLERYENSAEHSWHVCLTALLLKEYANEPVDIDKVITMLLIHDLGEIDAGDTLVYESGTEVVNEKELRGIKRLLEFLPAEKRDEYLHLWQEFETGKTPEALYARAVDRIPPLLHNLHGNGHSWTENNISKEQILSVSSRIDRGSHVLWEYFKAKIESILRKGILKQ